MMQDEDWSVWKKKKKKAKKQKKTLMSNMDIFN